MLSICTIRSGEDIECLQLIEEPSRQDVHLQLAALSFLTGTRPKKFRDETWRTALAGVKPVAVALPQPKLGLWVACLPQISAEGNPWL